MNLLTNALLKEWIMEALFRNALHFTTFLFYLVKFSAQVIIPFNSSSGGTRKFPCSF